MVVEVLFAMVEVFGYIGLFFASALGSATVILPMPLFALIFAAGAVLDPLLVGIIAGIGSAIGELIAYVVGYGGRKLFNKRKKTKKSKKGLLQWIRRAEAWMHKRGGFVVIFLFALTPLPDDVIGIICGSIKYDLKKFFIAVVIGKILLSLALAYAGFYGAQWVLGYLA